MYIDDSVRLRHMLDAAIQAISFIQDCSKDDLDSNQMLTFALLRCLEIIGEAASRVTKERQAELPQLPWAQIIGMRNRVVHAYYDIKLEVVWSTITQDLPPLIVELEKIIGSEEQD